MYLEFYIVEIRLFRNDMVETQACRAFDGMSNELSGL